MQTCVFPKNRLKDLACKFAIKRVGPGTDYKQRKNMKVTVKNAVDFLDSKTPKISIEKSLETNNAL